MKVLVFGAGSLGSLLGGLLARAHDVTLVGREQHVQRIRDSGLRISGAVETTVTPEAITDATGCSADLAVVTVKAFDTVAAAEALSTGRYETILSLQNGLTEETLASELDAPILAGTATYGARLAGPGHVVCTGLGRVVLGPAGGGTSTLADRVGEAFRAADIVADVSTEMPRHRWEKLAVNAGINSVTALARVENGALADGPASGLARRAAVEAAHVARAEGVDLSDDAAREAISSVIESTSKNRSSMLQDVESCSRTEVDAIAGEVVSRGQRHGLSVPVNRTLLELLRAWETGKGLR